MNSHEIRHVGIEEMRPWLRALRTGLLEDPATGLSEPILAMWRGMWDPDRVTGAFAGGRCVATLRTFATTLTVPAGADGCVEIAADALTQVSVAATHRRRGILRSMLGQSLRDAKERGEVVSVLRAAEWPIYGRYGYQPATMGADYRILSFRKPTILAPDTAVDVLQVEPDELVGPAAEVHRRLRLRQAGHIERTEVGWRRWAGLDGMRPAGKREPVCVLAHGADGTVDGFASWSAGDGDWFMHPMQAEAEVHGVLAATEDAYRALWAYLLGLDLVRVLTLEAYSVDEPLQWLLSDGRVATRTWSGDNDWLRLLDIPRALSARRYQVEDRLTLQITDDEPGGIGDLAGGRYTLDGGPDHAQCAPAPLATPDLRMSQRALAGVYLGGNTVRSQWLAGLIDEQTPGALRRLESMLWTARQPWNAIPF